MESEFMDRMLVAVKKKTGYDLDVDQLASFLDNYTGRSNKQLESALKRMIKGERGGEDVETSSIIDEMEIVLAARRAWE
jgi:hypothetical protein